MHELTILYEEEEYSEDLRFKAIRGIISYIGVLFIPGFLFILAWFFVIMQNKWDWNLIIGTAYFLFIAVVIYWWMLLRIFWIRYKTYGNTVKVTTEGIEVGTLFKANIEDIEKSIYNLSTGTLLISLKNGKKFKICKNISKISPLGGYAHFSYTEYGEALKKLGIPFEVVRRKGLFGVEPVRGREAYKEIRHRERYEKWIKRQQKEDGENLKIEGGDV